MRRAGPVSLFFLRGSYGASDVECRSFGFAEGAFVVERGLGAVWLGVVWDFWFDQRFGADGLVLHVAGI
jgi:hypothetical protein